MGKLCQLLEISRSGYYAWLRGGESARKTANQALLRELVRLHEKYPALGLDSLYHMLKPAFHCSRGRVHRLMKTAGIHSQRKRAYKATTNSRHNCPIAPKPAPTPVHFQPPQPSLGGRHHLHPHRGRLAVFRHCQRPVHQENCGVCLFPAHRHPAYPGRPEHGRPPGAPCPWTDLHSDRGVQYAAAAFRERLDSLGIRQSMSRKGDPYDNAVAENFSAA